MRLKTDAIDYKYFTEPNIVPIKLSDEFIKNAIDTSPELAESKLNRYKEAGLSEYDSSLLIASKDISDYYDEVTRTGANPKKAANWVIVDVQALLNKDAISIKEFKLSPVELGNLIKYIDEGKVSNKQAREIFNSMIETGKSAKELIEASGASLISDLEVLRALVKEILDKNEQSIIDYKAGKDRALGYIVGQIMKASKGRANPSVTSELVKEEISKR